MWHLKLAPVTMAGLERVVPFLTVEASVIALAKASAWPVKRAVVIQDTLEQTAVNWLIAMSLQIVVGTVCAFLLIRSTYRAGNQPTKSSKLRIVTLFIHSPTNVLDRRGRIRKIIARFLLSMYGEKPSLVHQPMSH